jgi:hypothetical protein
MRVALLLVRRYTTTGPRPKIGKLSPCAVRYVEPVPNALNFPYFC